MTRTVQPVVRLTTQLAGDISTMLGVALAVSIDLPATAVDLASET